MRNDILIVQPDPAQRAAIRAALESHGHSVIEADTEAQAPTLLSQQRPDLVLFHWSGMAAARTILGEVAGLNGASPRPCAIVTATETQLSEAIGALDMGCDDCLRVPADETELLARINASLRRRRGNRKEQLAIGPLLLDKDVHCLCINDEPVQLAPTEFRLLTFFLENPGRVFSRDEILKGAWEKNITAGSRTVDVHVRRLRQILEPYHCDHMIQTVRSFGYRLRQDAGA